MFKPTPHGAGEAAGTQVFNKKAIIMSINNRSNCIKSIKKKM